MNILIFASIGSENLGDELILKNEIFLLEQQYGEFFLVSKNELKFRVFSYNHTEPFFTKENIQYRNYFPNGAKSCIGFFKNIKSFFVLIKELISADIVVFGGGGLIYDSEHQSVGNPLRQWEFRALLCRIFRKRLDFFRIGVSISNQNNYARVKSIFKSAENISVRDEYSFSLLKKLGFGKRLSLEKDPVFSDKRSRLEQRSNTGRTLSRFSNTQQTNTSLLGAFDSKTFTLENIKNTLEVYGITLDGKNIGVSLRQLNIEGYDEKVLQLLQFLLEEKAKIIFIPHSFHKTDPKANDKIWAEKLKKILEDTGIERAGDITICNNMQESYNIYTEKKIELNIAQRLHAMILSDVYTIPFIGLSYSTKTKEQLADFRK